MLSSVDLSCVEAIARHGELAAAARELKRDPSTLFRWLNALETRLGASLFSRIRGRYVPSQRNSAGYGGLLLGISDSFLHKDQVSAKTGQLHFAAHMPLGDRSNRREYDPWGESYSLASLYGAALPGCSGSKCDPGNMRRPLRRCSRTWAMMPMLRLRNSSIEAASRGALMALRSATSAKSMVGRKSDTRAIALRTAGGGANSAARCRMRLALGSPPG